MEQFWCCDALITYPLQKNPTTLTDLEHSIVLKDCSKSVTEDDRSSSHVTHANYNGSQKIPPEVL